MRTIFVMLASTILASAGPAMAVSQDNNAKPMGTGRTAADCERLTSMARSACLQRVQRDAAKASSAGGATAGADCSTYSGAERTTCMNRAAGAAKGGTPGLSKQDALLVNSTNAAGQAKLAANDFAGAAADYQKAIDASPNNPVRHVLFAGLAVALRRQGIAAYNGGQQPSYPPPGASNEAIRQANAANAALQAQKTANALPLFRKALATAAQAATLADAQKDKAADGAISVELREDASLLYKIDRPGVLTTPRPSAELEADWLRRWLTATNPLAESLAAKYGVAVAAALVAKDPAAGLALADEVKARTGSDADGAMGYAEIVDAAKTPAGDPHRAKALAGLNAVDAVVVDSQQKARLTQLKTALSTPS